MKTKILTLLVLSMFLVFSCKKESVQPKKWLYICKVSYQQLPTGAYHDMILTSTLPDVKVYPISFKSTEGFVSFKGRYFMSSQDSIIHKFPFQCDCESYIKNDGSMASAYNKSAICAHNFEGPGFSGEQVKFILTFDSTLVN